MKIKSILNRLSFLLVLTVMVSACSQEVTDTFDNLQKEETRKFMYNMSLNCAAPNLDGGKTRSTTEWNEGAKVYLMFSEGNAKVPGTATYKDGIWEVETSQKLEATSSKADVVYIENPVTSSTSGNVEMDESSALYLGGAVYSVVNNVIYVSATLSPYVWRMRFAGEPSDGNTPKMVTLKPNDNDILVFRGFNTSTFYVAYGPADVQLTLTPDGYTPYIYGMFANPNGENKVTISTEGGKETFTRTIQGSKLEPGMSGVFNLPTSDNNNGWSPVVVSQFPDYSLNLGLTVDEIKAKYGEPLFVNEDYNYLFYSSTERTDIIDMIAYQYNGEKVVIDISLLLKDTYDDIIDLFNGMYVPYQNNGDQYVWLDNAEEPKMRVYYSRSMKAIEYEAIITSSWRSLGMVNYDEPFFCGGMFSDLDETVYEVEIEENIDNPGIFRLKSPYDEKCPFLSASVMDKNPHDIIINATDPDCVYISKQWTGVTLGYGEVFVSDIAGYYLSYGFTLDEIKQDFPESFGKLAGRCITFPTKTLLSHLGDDIYYANTRKAFVLTLPESANFKSFHNDPLSDFQDRNTTRRTIFRLIGREYPNKCTDFKAQSDITLKKLKWSLR